MRVERSGDQIYIGDFMGSISDSPSRQFSVAWGFLTNGVDPRSTRFALLRGDRILTQGEVSHDILDGRCSDGGHFALSVNVGIGRTSVLVFHPEGKLLLSKQFEGHLHFFEPSHDGRALFWASSNTAHCTNISTDQDVFSFSIDPRFYPTSAKLEEDGVTLSMRHVDLGWYRFAIDGTFPDHERWLNDYMNICDGASLYQLIREMHKRQGISGQEEAGTYALWVEEALRRGIEDSYALKVADVHEYLARLYGLAGRTADAEDATRRAEASLDGFRLVDRALRELDAIGDSPDEEAARRILADLDRALQTQRLHDYPNYLGRLYRTRGEILERLGDKQGAVAAYRKALESNPRAGCKKLLARLEGAPGLRQ